MSGHSKSTAGYAGILIILLVVLTGRAYSIEKAVHINQSGDFAVGLSAVYTYPFDDTNSDTKAGLGFDITLQKALTDRFTLRLNLGQSGLQLDNRPVYASTFYAKPATPPPPPGITIDYVRTQLRIYRLFLTGQMNSLPKATPVGEVVFYLHGGLGGIFHKTELETRVHDDSTGLDRTYVDKETIFKPAVTLGGGLVIKMTQRFGLDISAGTDLVYSETTAAAEFEPHRRAFGYDGTFDIKVGLLARF